MVDLDHFKWFCLDSLLVSSNKQIGELKGKRQRRDAVVSYNVIASHCQLAIWGLIAPIGGCDDLRRCQQVSPSRVML